MRSLITTTGGDFESSPTLNDRPRFIGIFNTSKYPGETVAHPTHWLVEEAAAGRLTMSKFISQVAPVRGRQQVALAAVTPGSARSCASPMRTASATLAVFEYLGPVSKTFMVTIFFASNPGSTAYSAAKLRINSPDPTSRTTATLTSLITSNARALFCRGPPPE